MTPVQEPQAWGDKLLNELRRRRVFRVATLYVVALWPIIQIVDIASPALEISDAVMKYLLIAFFSGLPIALILAWIFDLNADGVAVTGDGADGKPTRSMGVICSVDADGNPELQVHDAPRNGCTD